MGSNEPKGPDLYIIRRDLNPARPVVMRFEYKRGKHRSIKTVPFTRSWKQTRALPHGMEAHQIPEGEQLWCGALGLLGPQEGLPLVRLSMVMPIQASFSALVELAILGMVVGLQGVQVEFLAPDSGDPLPFGWPALARVCLAYANLGLPDSMAGKVVLEELLGLKEAEE